MIIDFEEKKIECDCGRVNAMDSVALAVCPCCGKMSVSCDDTECGYHEITPIVYRYIDTYQEVSG